MKKYLTEFIGAFFLVLTYILTLNNPHASAMAPLAIAGVYIAMIYAGSPVSGGHFNPAFTLAMWMSRKTDRVDALYYVIAQLLAAVFAATIGVYLQDCSGGLSIAERVNEQSLCAVLGEFLGTFALTYVAIQVSSTHPKESNTYYGLAVGVTAMAMMFGLAGLSGGAFNPAIALGASVAGMFAWEDIWVYFIGAVLGAAGAATVVQVMEKKDDF